MSMAAGHGQSDGRCRALWSCKVPKACVWHLLATMPFVLLAALQALLLLGQLDTTTTYSAGWGVLPGRAHKPTSQMHMAGEYSPARHTRNTCTNAMWLGSTPRPDTHETSQRLRSSSRPHTCIRLPKCYYYLLSRLGSTTRPGTQTTTYYEPDGWLLVDHKAEIQVGSVAEFLRGGDRNVEGLGCACA